MEYQTPLEKCQYFDFLDYLGFFLALKGLFSVYNIVKHIFLAYIAYKKGGRMASFLPEPWTNLKITFSTFFNFLS